MTSAARTVVGFFIVVPLMVLAGLPGAVYILHGFGVWPPAVTSFIEGWWQHVWQLDVFAIVQILWKVLRRQSEIFGSEGPEILMVLAAATALIILAYAMMAPAPNRKVLDGQLGDAQICNGQGAC